MKVHIRNTTDIPTTEVRRAVRFILDMLPPLPEFDVQVRNSNTGNAGRAYISGSSYHDTRRPFVVLRVQRQARYTQPHHPKFGRSVFPKPWAPYYQMAQHKGKRYWFANRTEALIELAAHEIRHLWQKAYPKAGRYPNSRGVFSEVDTTAFSIHCLRGWRKAQEIATPSDTP